MTFERRPLMFFIRSTAMARPSPIAVPVSWMLPMCMRSMPFSTQILLIVSGLSRYGLPEKTTAPMRSSGRFDRKS